MIDAKFQLLKERPSDINEHLETLYKYACECEHITEMGVRGCVSTWAFLKSRRPVVCYDILRSKNVTEIEQAGARFIKADVLGVDILPTDLLFIDTLHTYDQLSKELQRHADNVRKYIILHDTESFGIKDEPIYTHASKKITKTSKQGLLRAVQELKGWHIQEHHRNNNGLTVLARNLKTRIYITNYDPDKQEHVKRIINELKQIEFIEPEILVLSTRPADVGAQMLIYPKKFSKSKYRNRWQPEPEFIWLHRKLLDKDKDNYDLFIHLEDDVLLTRDTLAEFLSYNLPEGYSIGQFVVEGENIVSMHGAFGDIKKIETIQGQEFIINKNDHQASWILTKDQVRYCYNHGLTSEPKCRGIYNIKCTACSEFYTIIQKVIPVDFSRSMVTHLSGRYQELIGKRNSPFKNGYTSIKKLSLSLKQKPCTNSKKDGSTLTLSSAGTER